MNQNSKISGNHVIIDAFGRDRGQGGWGEPRVKIDEEAERPTLDFRSTLSTPTSEMVGVLCPISAK